MGRDTKTVQLQSELKACIFSVSEPVEEPSYDLLLEECQDGSVVMQLVR